MDITFQTNEGVFNYRAGAVIIHEDKLLVMKDECAPHFYLPGGRVAMRETAEQAVLRELKEELEIDAQIERALWMAQSFFTDDVNHKRYHEICMYYLIDISSTDLLTRGDEFILTEGGKHHLVFSWIPLASVKDLYIYPLFLKSHIERLPEQLECIVEFE